MQGDRFADELLDLGAGVGDHAESGEVGAVGAPTMCFVFDDDEVFAHGLGLGRPA